MLRDIAQHGTRVGAPVHASELEDEVGRRGDLPAHRRFKKLLFGFEVAQDGRGRDAELRRDVGQRRPLEPLYREDPPRGFKKLIAGDARRPTH